MTLALAGIWGKFLDEGKTLRMLLAPGFVLVLVFKHLACLCTGAKAKESKPFGPGDEILTHEDPTLPVVGHPLMAFIPFFGTIVVLGALIAGLWGEAGLAKLVTLPVLPRGVAGISPFFHQLGAFFAQMWETMYLLIVKADWRGPVTLYACICVVFAIRPCYKDTWALLASLAVLAGIALVCEYFGIGFTRSTAGQANVARWGRISMATVGMVIATALTLLVLSGLTIGIARLGGWAKEGHDKSSANIKSKKA